MVFNWFLRMKFCDWFIRRVVLIGLKNLSFIKLVKVNIWDFKFDYN